MLSDIGLRRDLRSVTKAFEAIAKALQAIADKMPDLNEEDETK